MASATVTRHYVVITVVNLPLATLQKGFLRRAEERVEVPLVVPKLTSARKAFATVIRVHDPWPYSIHWASSKLRLILASDSRHITMFDPFDYFTYVCRPVYTTPQSLTLRR
jgi:hypothetical protein